MTEPMCICAWHKCGAEFVPTHGQQKYCCHAHYKRANAAQTRAHMTQKQRARKNELSRVRYAKQCLNEGYEMHPHGADRQTRPSGCTYALYLVELLRQIT